MPWLPVNENHTFLNVAAQDSASGSVLNYFRALTKLRKSNPVLVYGSYQLLDVKSQTCFAYLRTLDSNKLLGLINFGDAPAQISIPNLVRPIEVLVDNYGETQINQLQLKPWQARILRIE